jgi:MFS family permease
MLPLIFGFLVAGPASGYLSDHFGARPFATGGLLLAALSFALLIVLPVDFSYIWFALILLLNGIGMGLFASPNSAGVMNSLPPSQRGAGAGMLATFMNSASVLSIGVFFTLMIIGLAAKLPDALQSGLVAHGVSAADAHRVSALPPVATLFASFLGYNPMATLLGPHVIHSLSAAQAHTLTGRQFFPALISDPFHSALVYAFVFAILACLVAAVASLLRGGKYHHADEEATVPAGAPGGLEPVEPERAEAVLET